jgi:hypothetical protein
MGLLMKIGRLIIVILILLFCRVSLADDQASFIVTGNITKTNQPDRKTFIFSLDELLKLPNTVVRTKTIWTPTSTFEGPLLRDILKDVGAKENATEIEVKSLDNFPATIPIADLNRWEVILARSQDGQRLQLKTRGPFLIMYPVDKYKSELDNNLTRTKIVWAVNGMVVH